MLGRLKAEWFKLKQYVFLRRAPHVILSYKYFLPNASPGVRLHRRIFLKAWCDYPRLLWFCVALYSYTFWFFFWGWKQLFTVWKKQSQKLWEQQDISRSQQFIDLLYLTFLQTTPPYFYYSYKIYDTPKSRWLDYIYTHELPHWHTALSPNLTPETVNFLSDKTSFAQKMAQNNLPFVPSTNLDKHVDKLKQQIFNRTSLFLKPQQGSRKIGCFLLDYSDETQEYQLILSESESITHPGEIISYLERQTEPYLVQPRLVNHPKLQTVCPSDDLITFRVITMMDNGKANTISAVLEWPKRVNSSYVYAVPIEVKSGKLLKAGQNLLTKEEPPPVLAEIEMQIVPFWKEVVDTVERAHEVFPDISTIGWDVAISQLGVKLIEGNINWGVASHQQHGPHLMPFYIQKS